MLGPVIRKHTDSFIAECKAAIAALRSEYQKLLKEKHLLDEKLEAIKAKAANYMEILKSDGVFPEGCIEPEKLGNADRAYEIVSQAGKPMHALKIWELLRQQGVSSNSKDPVNMLAATLSNDDRFRKTAPRTFDVNRAKEEVATKK